MGQGAGQYLFHPQTSHHLSKLACLIFADQQCARRSSLCTVGRKICAHNTAPHLFNVREGEMKYDQDCSSAALSCRLQCNDLFFGHVNRYVTHSFLADEDRTFSYFCATERSFFSRPWTNVNRTKYIFLFCLGLNTNQD